jgi:Bacterial PH domain
MSDAFASTIEQELGSGERVLWKGRPRGGLRLRGSDLYLIPFSLIWGGFAIFWEAMALFGIPKNNTPGVLFPIFGIPFVLFGLYFIFGRFFVDAKMRESAEYAVTNQRAIIVSGIFSRSVRSVNLQTTSEITLTERPDRSGTITFGSPPPYGRWGQRDLLFPGTSAQPAFEMIEDARTVYGIIEKAKQG